MMDKLPARRIEPSMPGLPAGHEVAPASGDAGLAFAIDDLILARGWAARRGLRLTIQVDHVQDGLGYEELLWFTPFGHAIRCLSLWRSGEGVALRTVAGQVQLHRSLGEALQHWEQGSGGRMLRLSAWINLRPRRGRRPA